MARRYGATDEILETLDDLDRCSIPEDHKAAIRFAETMTRDSHAIGQQEVDALRAHFDDDQIVEISCVVGLFNYLNRFADAMGLWPTRPGEGGPEDGGAA